VDLSYDVVSEINFWSNPMRLIDTFIDAELTSVEKLLESHPDYFDAAIPPSQAAGFIGSTVAALAQMRSRGGGPTYIRIAPHKDRRGYVRGPIRYTRRDLIGWLRDRRCDNTAAETVR
jgi:hypothetical protein